ncbi:MAG: ATP-binding protein [Lentibacter sp.]|uniref:sensor histidine kinase n=1 Tax=Lentibacter sp. TaxID=2024994 RepID=UPI00262C99BB|nr:ATP-binding protein [Lentibacter sp.]MDG1288987.1 ATP-binding protein [Lentibacter sp.]
MHDGPAQHLSLAALRLDSAFDKNAGPNARGEIRASIDRALEEIRAISRGLALPELEQMDLASLVRAAISEREVQSGIDVNVTFSGSEPKHLSYTEKLCVYRFLQEGLSNAVRHGGVKSAEVRVEADTKIIEISIHDDGSGFDMETVPGLHATGGQGLTGLRDRAESIGGSILVSSNPRSGTTLTLTLLREQYNGNPTNPRR